MSALDCKGRTIWIADAHRGDAKRFVVCADEELSAFVELERAIHQFAVRLSLDGCASEKRVTAGEVWPSLNFFSRAARNTPVDEIKSTVVGACWAGRSGT